MSGAADAINEIRSGVSRILVTGMFCWITYAAWSRQAMLEKLAIMRWIAYRVLVTDDDVEASAPRWSVLGKSIESSLIEAVTVLDPDAKGGIDATLRLPVVGEIRVGWSSRQGPHGIFVGDSIVEVRGDHPNLERECWITIRGDWREEEDMVFSKRSVKSVHHKPEEAFGVLLPDENGAIVWMSTSESRDSLMQIAAELGVDKDTPDAIIGGIILRNAAARIAVPVFDIQVSVAQALGLLGGLGSILAVFLAGSVRSIVGNSGPSSVPMAFGFVPRAGTVFSFVSSQIGFGLSVITILACPLVPCIVGVSMARVLMETHVGGAAWFVCGGIMITSIMSFLSVCEDLWYMRKRGHVPD